jgi:hypothetical protein
MRARIIFAAAAPVIARLNGASDAVRPVATKKNCANLAPEPVAEDAPALREPTPARQPAHPPATNQAHPPRLALRCRRSSHLDSTQTVATIAN